jgi:hypothetical protein
LAVTTIAAICASFGPCAKAVPATVTNAVATRATFNVAGRVIRRQPVVAEQDRSGDDREAGSQRGRHHRFTQCHLSL